MLLKVTLPTEERTFRALAWEVNARVAMAEQDLDKALDFLAKGLQSMNGYELPLAEWGVCTPLQPNFTGAWEMKHWLRIIDNSA